MAFAAYDAALDAICLAAAAGAIRDFIAEFEKELGGMESRGGDLERHFAAASRVIQERIRDSEEEREAQKEGPAVVVPGLSKDEVYGRLMAEIGACDPSDLAGKMVVPFRDCFLRLVLGRYPRVPRDEPFTWRLVLSHRDVDIADALLAIISQNLGRGMTFLERVKAVGRQHIVEELDKKAAPAVHVDGRATNRFGLHITERKIARLPAGDSELTALFQKSGYETEELPEDAESIRVTCLQMGFPIGLDEKNLSLLGDYARSAEQNHHPHLPVHPDFPEFGVWPFVVKIASNSLRRS
jgi:hypothetical protein